MCFEQPKLGFWISARHKYAAPYVLILNRRGFDAPGFCEPAGWLASKPS